MVRQLVQASVCSHKGSCRVKHEDNFCMNGLTLSIEGANGGAELERTFDDPLQLYAVCDGMGGEAAGEQAAFLAADGVRGVFRGQGGIPSRIDEAVARLNRAVCGLPEERAGTTLALLCLDRGVAHIAHLGDSRAYLLRGGILRCLTVDHTQAQRLANLGLLDERQIAGHPASHRLTRYLGMRGEEARPDHAPAHRVRKGDLFLLCSDGLSGVVGERQMASLLREPDPAHCLVEAALRAESMDNITALVVRMRAVPLWRGWQGARRNDERYDEAKP